MKALFEKVGTGLLSAIAGGIVTIILFLSGWIWAGLFDKMKFEIANLVVQQMAYFPEQSEEKIQHVNFSCPQSSKIVTASCIEHDSGNHLQVAIATFEKDGSLSCDRYGGDDPNAKVQATAICFKIKNTFE